MFKFFAILSLLFCVVAASPSWRLSKFISLVDKNADAKVQFFDCVQCLNPVKEYPCDGKCIPYDPKMGIKTNVNVKATFYQEDGCKKNLNTIELVHDQCLGLRSPYPIKSFSCVKE